MDEMNRDIVFFEQVFSQMFGTIDRAVLSSGTSESDLEVCEITFKKALDVVVDKFIHRIKEGQDFAVGFKEINHRLVESCERFEFIVLAWVMCRTAVEHVPSTIAGVIGRNTFFIRERINRY